MLDRLNDYDWEEVFKYADGTPVLDSLATKGPFTREDVVLIVACVDGENDGDAWVCAGRLRDGRWFRISASCDYTGWGCQEGGDSSVASSLEELIRFGMSDEERTRLGLLVSAA